jgi:hypothetical protein
VVRAVEEPGELFCEMSLLVPLQFEEDVLLAREVEKKKVPCATPAAATIAFTSAPAIPTRLNSATAASRRRCRVWSRRVSRADGLTCGVMVCHL